MGRVGGNAKMCGAEPAPALQNYVILNLISLGPARLYFSFYVDQSIIAQLHWSRNELIVTKLYL